MRKAAAILTICYGMYFCIPTVWSFWLEGFNWFVRGVFIILGLTLVVLGFLLFYRNNKRIAVTMFFFLCLPIVLLVIWVMYMVYASYFDDTLGAAMMPLLFMFLILSIPIVLNISAIVCTEKYLAKKIANAPKV